MEKSDEIKADSVLKIDIAGAQIRSDSQAADQAATRSGQDARAPGADLPAAERAADIHAEKQRESRIFKAQVVVAFFLLYVVWGSTYIAIKYAIHTIPTFMMGGVRFLIAGLIVYIISTLMGHKQPGRENWKSAAIVGVLLLAIGNGGVAIATKYAPTGVVSLMVAMTPVYMSIMADFGKRFPSRPTIIGLILGTIGVVCLVGPAGLQGTISWIGIVAATLASLSWSAGSIYSRTAKLATPTIMAVATQMICGGLAMLIISFAIGEHSTFDLANVSTRSVLSIIYLIVFGSLVGYSAYFWLLKNVSPSKVSTYAYVNPIVAVFLGWWLAGEAVTANIFVAAAIIVLSVWLITKSNVVKAPEPLAALANKKSVKNSSTDNDKVDSNEGA